MDTACGLEATVACGEIFSEDVNILQTERYFSRTFLEIFAIFINYPPRFCKLRISKYRTKISRLRCHQRDAKFHFSLVWK